MFGTKIAMAATACLLFSLPFSGLAAADAVHRIAFKVDPVVLVWQDKAEPTELIPAAVRDARPAPVITGRLESVADRQDRSALQLHSREFRVASNAPYRINATLVGVDGGSTTPFRLSIVDSGENAAVPSAFAAGPLRTTLGTLAREPVLVDDAPKTAIRNGSVDSQSITYRATWSGGAGEYVNLKVFLAH